MNMNSEALSSIRGRRMSQEVVAVLEYLKEEAAHLSSKLECENDREQMLRMQGAIRHLRRMIASIDNRVDEEAPQKSIYA